MAAIDPDAYRLGARAVWLADQRERAAAIRIPTLDPRRRRRMRSRRRPFPKSLRRLIPGSRLEIIRGASHLANLDKPAEFNRAIDDFLATLEEGVREESWKPISSTRSGPPEASAKER